MVGALPTMPALAVENMLDLIGGTPIVRLRHLVDASMADVFCKCEQFNPGGSLKDRIALSMIEAAEREGRIRPGESVIVEPTSGNTGVGLAVVAAAKGYKLILTMPDNMSLERRALLKAYGAEVVLSDAAEGSDGAIRVCRKIYEEDPDRYFYPDQYNNPANWKAHFDGTALEIIEQTRGRITHFVASMGTSGTFIGNTKRFRRDLPNVKCISVQPSSGFHGLEGLKHMPTAIRPGFYDDTLADENLWMETEDAYRMVRRLAREEGLLVGISSGCNVHAATVVARDLVSRGETGIIVTVLCDSAEKYLSEHFWDEE